MTIVKKEIYATQLVHMDTNRQESTVDYIGTLELDQAFFQITNGWSRGYKQLAKTDFHSSSTYRKTSI